MSHPRSTQDKYVLKSKPQEQTEKNEIRIGAGGITASYIRYAANLYREHTEHKPEEAYTVLIKGSGAAISKACTVAEILRHRIKGLSQIIKITNNEVVDEYLPTEEGLSNVVIKRKLTVIEIKLTTEKLEGKDVLGFHAPLPESEVREFNAPREAGDEPSIFFFQYIFFFLSHSIIFSFIFFLWFFSYKKNFWIFFFKNNKIFCFLILIILLILLKTVEPEEDIEEEVEVVVEVVEEAEATEVQEVVAETIADKTKKVVNTKDMIILIMRKNMRKKEVMRNQVMRKEEEVVVEEEVAEAEDMTEIEKKVATEEEVPIEEEIE